jgi:hypothetical protein
MKLLFDALPLSLQVDGHPRQPNWLPQFAPPSMLAMPFWSKAAWVQPCAPSFSVLDQTGDTP